MLVEDSVIKEVIEQANVLRKRLQQSICGVEQLISSKSSPITSHPSTPPLLPPDSCSKTTEVPTALPISGSIPSPKSTDTSRSRIKLPKLMPKIFNDDLTKWETFWDTHGSSIHLNSTDVDNFMYFQSLLEGAAMRAIAGLKHILHKRFGDNWQIISRYTDTFSQSH